MKKDKITPTRSINLRRKDTSFQFSQNKLRLCRSAQIKRQRVPDSRGRIREQRRPIRHKSLMEKVSMLGLPDSIFNWIVGFLTGRAHCTKFNDQTSTFASLTASVIQGSALGPALFLSQQRICNRSHQATK